MWNTLQYNLHYNFFWMKLCFPWDNLELLGTLRNSFRARDRFSWGTLYQGLFSDLLASPMFVVRHSLSWIITISCSNVTTWYRTWFWRWGCVQFLGFLTRHDDIDVFDDGHKDLSNFLDCWQLVDFWLNRVMSLCLKFMFPEHIYS